MAYSKFKILIEVGYGENGFKMDIHSKDGKVQSSDIMGALEYAKTTIQQSMLVEIMTRAIKGLDVKNIIKDLEGKLKKKESDVDEDDL